MRNKILTITAILAFASVCLATRPVFAFESVTDMELSEIRGSDGSVLGLFPAEVLGAKGLSEAQAKAKWDQMSESEKEQARKRFRQSLLNMTPEERAAVRQKMLERFQALSPNEQEEIRSRMNDRLNFTTPAERKEFDSFRKSFTGPGPAPGGGR